MNSPIATHVSLKKCKSHGLGSFSFCMKIETQLVKDQSNSSLSHTLTIDTFSAILSSALVAPAISIIDQAIFSNASGKETMGISIRNSLRKLVFSPGQFVKQPQFLWIWAVYSGTYIVANCTETVANHKQIDYAFPKFITSSAANISLSLAKDGYYTRKFGTAAKGSVPMGSYLCYGVRDSSTVLAGFILPKHGTEILVNYGLNRKTAGVASQLFTPCLMQFLSVPLHLYGMDLYNNPQHTTSDRMKFLKREYAKTVGARIGRIFPAFGVGGVANTWLRSHFK
jgi:hypothetical protein